MPVTQSLRKVQADFRGSLPVTPLASFVDNRVLAGANEDHTVPTGAAYVIITATANIFVKNGGTAADPAADVTNGSGSILVFAGVARCFELHGATTIGLIGTADVSLEWFLA